jgi:hypothetical protein
MMAKIIDDENSSDDNDNDGIDTTPINIVKSKVVENTQAKAGNKKGKRSKRLEKDERKEKEVLALKLQDRINLEQKKKLEKVPTIAVNDTESTKTGPKCNTCETFFPDVGAFRIHFKSEWHRCNVNRKAKSTPIIASECEFLALSIEELALFT